MSIMLRGRYLASLGSALTVVFTTPGAATAVTTASAAPSQVIGGCTIVANPTATDFTNCRGADLRGLVGLSGIDLSYANLKKADITDTDVAGDSLVHANLAGAHFADTNLTAVALWGANLTGTHLGDAYLVRATSGAIIGTPASLPPHWVLQNTYLAGPGADLMNASLNLADFMRDNLTGADMSGAALALAEFRAANLTNVSFFGANLSEANLNGANLTGANLAGASLKTFV